MTNSTTKTPLPTATDTLISMEQSFGRFLLETIEDDTSELSKLFDGNRAFSSTQELQSYLQQALSGMWGRIGSGMQELGFPDNPDAYRGYSKTEFQEYLRRFTEGIYRLIEPAIERRAGRLYLNLGDQASLEKILKKMENELGNSQHGSPLPLGQDNALEQASLAHIRSALTILPAELRAHIGQAGYSTPVSSDHQIYREKPMMKLAKTGLMTTTILFMSYGIHGLIGTGVTKLAESQPDQLNNIWSSLLQSPGLYGTTSWGLSIAAAYSVGTALLKPAQKIRQNLIQSAEADKKVSAMKAVGSSGFAALALAVPITFGVIDAAGIFNREAEGYIVGHVAYQTREKLATILDIKDPNSPIGQAWGQYDTNTNTLTTFSRDFVAAEANRPGASGQGPAYKAKEFVLKGEAVVSDPLLARDSGLKSVVDKANDALKKINAENHAQYPGLPDKARRVQEFFGNRTDTLVNGYTDTQTGKTFAGINSFDPMIAMNQHGPLYHFLGQIPGIGGGVYKSHDLAILQGQFGDEASEFLSAVEAVNKSWGERSKVYQTYIQEVSDIADAKYNSRTSVTIPSAIPVPDLSGLTEALSQKPPKISALWPQASYDELQKIKGQPGGISESHLNQLVTFSLIRPFALEFASLALIIASLFAMSRFYRNPRNKLSGKKEKLDQAYNALISAVQKTFSGDTWQALFPGHPGIDEQEAEYIVREIATDMHPELLDFFPTAKRDISGAKKQMYKGATFLKNIHQGNTRTSDESYVINLAQALEKMGLKSTGNIGINTETIRRICERIIPAQYLNTYSLTPEALGNIAHGIQENLTAITIEKDASYAVESGIHKKVFAQRIDQMLSKIQLFETGLIPKLQQSIVAGNLGDDAKKVFSDMISEIESIRIDYEALLQNEHPTGREITGIENRIKELQTSTDRYKIRP